MAWTTPKTWTAALVTVADFNTYIRDNQAALKDPPTDVHTADEGADWTTSSTSFVDVDATDLSLTITTTGGDVMIGFHGNIAWASPGAYATYFDVTMDGTRIAGDDGIFRTFGNVSGANHESVCFVRLVQSVSAGSHTFNLQWKVTSGSTVSLYAGAGTAGNDVHPQFWVREVS